MRVVDMFYKIHKIFGLSYEPRLEKMMLFLERFVYGIKGKPNLTTRMQEIIKYIESDDQVDEEV